MVPSRMPFLFMRPGRMGGSGCLVLALPKASAAVTAARAAAMISGDVQPN